MKFHHLFIEAGFRSTSLTSVTLSLVYSSSSRVGHKAPTVCFHRDRSFATSCASPHVKPISFSSAIAVRLKVVLGRPCLLFLFPGGVHLRAVLVHSEDMTKPTELAVFDLKYHTLTLCFLAEFVIQDLVGPENAAYPLEAAIVEGLNPVHRALHHTPAINTTELA